MDHVQVEDILRKGRGDQSMNFGVSFRIVASRLKKTPYWIQIGPLFFPICPFNLKMNK